MTLRLLHRYLPLPLAALAAAAVALPAEPVHAAPPAPARLALFARAFVWIDSTSATSARVCADGAVDDGTPITGRWVFRVTATPITVWTNDHSGSTYPRTCYTISSSGAVAGVAEATIAYVGVGGDALAHCTESLTWAPGFPIKGLAFACVGFPTPIRDL